MAVCILELDQNNLPTRRRSFLYIADLSDNIAKKVLEAEYILSLDWRAENELWVSVMQTRLGFRPSYKLLCIRDNPPGKFTIKPLSWPALVDGLCWSPDGRILAGRPGQDYSVFRRNKKNYFGSVAVSFDGGKSAVPLTEPPVFASVLYWKNNHSFYIHPLDKKTLLEVTIDQKKISISQSIPYEQERFLSGIYKDTAVLMSGGDVYVGEKIIYHSNSNIRWLRSSYPYLAFIEKTDLVVINPEENSVLRHTLETDKVSILDLIPEKKTVYWLRDKEKVYCWNFQKDSVDCIFDLKKIGMSCP